MFTSFRDSFQLTAEEEKFIRDPIMSKYDKEGHPYYSSGRLVCRIILAVLWILWIVWLAQSVMLIATLIYVHLCVQEVRVQNP